MLHRLLMLWILYSLLSFLPLSPQFVFYNRTLVVYATALRKNGPESHIAKLIAHLKGLWLLQGLASISGVQIECHYIKW